MPRALSRCRGPLHIRAVSAASAKPDRVRPQRRSGAGSDRPGAAPAPSVADGWLTQPLPTELVRATMQLLSPGDLLAAAAVCRHWHFVATSCRELLVARLLAEAPAGGSMFEPRPLLDVPQGLHNSTEGSTTQQATKTTAMAGATSGKAGLTRKRKVKRQKKKVVTVTEATDKVLNKQLAHALLTVELLNA